MKRNMIPFLSLLLSAALLVLGAVMPKLVASRQDAVNDNQVLFASIKNVQLEFTQDEMTVSRAVAMVGNNWQSTNIPESLTKLGMTKARQIALAAAERYRQAGLFSPGVEKVAKVTFCQPVLMYAGKESWGIVNEEAYGAGAQTNGQPGAGASSTLSNIYWVFNLMDESGLAYFQVFIDDRTGTVCSVSYSGNGLTQAQRGWQDKESVLSAFCDLYLTDLGEEFYWCQLSDILDGAKSPVDGSYLASEISWQDDILGECHVTFFVNDIGFYTSIMPTKWDG